jgi:AraC-like DNA-binding protein
MQYLRRAQFVRTRQALQRAEPGKSVTAIATPWGFAHLGRSSAEYRRAFGETPSRTPGVRLPRRRS